MHTGAIITMIVGTVTVLLVPAVVLAGSMSARRFTRRDVERH